jgi:hypothetical protein
MKNLTLLLATVFAICISGCKPDVDTPLVVTTPNASSQRISVTRIGVIEDVLSYHGQRGIYIITDAKTGAEYVGVSGIGISELGSHRSGKTTISDER